MRLTTVIRKQPQMRLPIAIVLLALAHQPTNAQDWRCAGLPSGGQSVAAKPLAHAAIGGHAVVLFAGFPDEPTSSTPPPAWADKLFDSDLPGSISHYYQTMSFGQLRLEGSVASQRCTSHSPPSGYQVRGSGPASADGYGVFVLEGPDPQQDRAGIGRWGLMGWGALGWPGGDSPASMCAWRRQQLGWAQVAEPGNSRETMVLENVGREGAVYRISLSQTEYFLVEYRTRASSHYDHSITGEGLLVWHVDRPSWLEERAGGWRVDLECADGLWRQAGYPLGITPDPEGGEDNLDFWAHDDTYRKAHGGNLGDATDPFDGVRYTAFTSQTNPSSLSHAGLSRAYFERIRLQGGVATAEVVVMGPDLQLTSTSSAAYGVVAGGPLPVPFAAANHGGLPLTGLVLRLRSDDPLVEIVDEEIELADLNVGQESVGNWLSATGFPRVRIHRCRGR